MALLSPNGSVPPGKKSVLLTAYNVFCCLSGSTGIFFPEILPVKEDRRTPFQNTVIDTGVGQIRRVFQLGQFQVCCDNHGPAAAVAAVDDEKHLLHSIFGTALYSQIVNDKQVILVKAGNKLRPVLREHPGQAVQDGGKVRHQHRHIPVKQGVGDATGEKGLAGSHIPEQQQALTRKAQGLQDRYLYDYTFSNDNGQNPLMDKAHAYVENWKEAYKSNIGLLLFGDVGTGKSFFAGCIANALLDRDVPVLMTNFPTILNRLTGMFSEDRADFIASFDEYDLLIIDDLGVERSTEYAMEQMFFVIDSRYRSRRPMIITTNLKLAELKNPPDLAHARIYDRILERCAPILFDEKNFREENAGATRQTAKDIVNSKQD